MMPRLARDPREESVRLHRARRAAELRERDAALCAADLALADVKRALAHAVLAVMRGRPEAPELVAAAAAQVEQARLILRTYFDNNPGESEHGRY